MGHCILSHWHISNFKKLMKFLNILKINFAKDLNGLKFKIILVCSFG